MTDGFSKGRLSRLAASLLAGAVAIAVNTGLLFGGDAVGFTTAHGGLLRLVKIVLGQFAGIVGGADVWRRVILPAISGPGCRAEFHVFVGLLMAVFYAFVVEPLLPGRPWVKGLIYATVVWLLNAFVVLPLIREGIAGSQHLQAAGIVGFAAIHTVFFLLLAVIYASLRGGRRRTV